MSKACTAEQSVLQWHDCPVTAVPAHLRWPSHLSDWWQIVPADCTHLHKDLARRAEKPIMKQPGTWQGLSVSPETFKSRFCFWTQRRGLKLGLEPQLAMLSPANHREKHHHMLIFKIFPYEIFNSRFTSLVVVICEKNKSCKERWA